MRGPAPLYDLAVGAAALHAGPARSLPRPRARHHTPFHTHVLETKTQAVTGPELFGRSLIRYMADLGLLNRNVTIAHSVWVSDDDMALMGEAGLSVVHNAISNQKLGAGVAPLRRLLDAGVTVALGTDGASSNDTLRIFDVMRVAALIHSVSGPDYGAVAHRCRYPSRGDDRRRAERDARGRDRLAGGRQEGRPDRDPHGWARLHAAERPGKHLVYCENGSGDRAGDGRRESGRRAMAG